MSREATPRQLEVLAALRVLLGKSISPTYVRLAEEVGCCQTYAYQAILSLEKKGMVTRTPKKHGVLGVVYRS